MNLTELEKSITNIRKKIFDYDISELQTEILLLIEMIQNKIVNLSTEDLMYFKEISNYITVALQNKDYLVLGDILKYELLPLFKMVKKEN